MHGHQRSSEGEIYKEEALDDHGRSIVNRTDTETVSKAAFENDSGRR